MKRDSVNVLEFLKYFFEITNHFLIFFPSSNPFLLGYLLNKWPHFSAVLLLVVCVLKYIHTTRTLCVMSPVCMFSGFFGIG